MPMWRCPHCGTPQAESSRCWVCKRSSTSCGTCRHFRHAIAGQLGYCGLDRQRLPLRGDEQRGCWEARPATEAEAARTAPRGEQTLGQGARRRLEFVPLDGPPEPTPDTAVAGPSAAPTPAVARPPDPAAGFWADER